MWLLSAPLNRTVIVPWPAGFPTRQVSKHCAFYADTLTFKPKGPDMTFTIVMLIQL